MAGYPTPRILVFRTDSYGSGAGRRHENCKFRDRIDLHVEVPPVNIRELSSDGGGGESSAAIRTRVAAAREIRSERFRKSANATNSAMGPRQVKAHCKLDAEITGYLEHAMEEINFSARAHDRILKVARTLAYLSRSVEILPTTFCRS
jgi:magnesium chelatase family protein